MKLTKGISRMIRFQKYTQTVRDEVVESYVV